MKVIWERQALADLRRIQRYIARDNPTAARRWSMRLTERAHEAVHHPQAGRKVPEFDRDDVREVFLKSYRIIYRVTADAIRVLTVVEGHRQLPEGERADGDQ